MATLSAVFHRLTPTFKSESRVFQNTLSDIAKTGANTIRMVLASGDRWNKTSESTVSDLIEQANPNISPGRSKSRLAHYIYWIFLEY
jgi:hypothetical protein